MYLKFIFVSNPKNNSFFKASIKFTNMMKNTKYLFALSVVIAFVLTSSACTKCPECPSQNNIVTDDVDTMSFKIVTDDVDTMSFQIVTPVVKRDGKVEKSSIVIDNVDMARFIIGTIDTTNYSILTRPKQEKQNAAQQR